MTENPLYRRGYVDSPFQNWRPPSNEYAVRYNQNPNAAQDLRNLFGNLFAQNSAAQNYSPQYQPPYQTTMPTYNPYQAEISPSQQANNRFIQNEVAPPVLDHATQQAIQLATMGWAGSQGLGALGRQYYPLAMATLAATRYGAPIARGIERFANSPVGKAVGKVADWIF